jgi:S1-C subfamily serine protease
LPGDVIYAINGQEISSLASLRARLAELQTGDPVVVQVQRQENLRFITFEIE